MLLSFCQGGELFDKLKPIKHFVEREARFYAACVCEALVYLHTELDHPIAFRDLKLENILIDAQGYAVLADLGTSKQPDGNLTFTLCGTPEYLAPEVILGRGHNETADWWSF